MKTASLRPCLAAGDLDAVRRLLRRPGAGLYIASPSARAFTAAALRTELGGQWIWVTDGPRTLERLAADMESLAPPAVRWIDLPPRDDRPGDAAMEGRRLKALDALGQPDPPGLLLTSIQVLMQPLPEFRAGMRRRRLAVGERCDPQELGRWLDCCGYAARPQVSVCGEWARRGGILDVWPPSESVALRIEFFGDVIDSIRQFDPDDQISRDRIREVVVLPAGEEKHGAAVLTDYLPAASNWVWVDPPQLEEHSRLYAELRREQSLPAGLPGYPRLLEEFRQRGIAAGLRVLREPAADAQSLAFESQESLPRLAAGTLEPDLLAATRRQMAQRLADSGQQVHIFFDTEAGRERFRQAHPGVSAAENVFGHISPLSAGFSYPAADLQLVSESDLYGPRGAVRRRAGRKVPSSAVGTSLTGLAELQPGERVVHVDHGIGRYLGLQEMKFQGVAQEVLCLEYADSARLYVPVSQAHLLSRYVGCGGHVEPPLHRLGGARWRRQRAAAARAIEDMASSLLETQAAREVLEGFACPPDSEWQREFEAAFPFEETFDQRRAIEDVRRDLEDRRPMDRLICGDVGYGKTEVAVRAAFKVVEAGRQAAVLVPTTVLAQQHFNTFRARMAAFPVTVEMLSRFRTRAQQQAAVRGLADGRVDIVIGTHRLLQRDIRFANLGLVVIDEEQRFGVEHKERFKHLRSMVDVLTMTATPIPRTLYLSLTGARDMNTIQTPPRDRQPVETVVCENRGDIVRHAILRELNREGQVFFLHNRVQTIHRVEQWLHRLVPEARIGVGHGQMNEKKLAAVMDDFVDHRIDVLLSTTIIENGMDIPNANTILIDRADRFGMAELYQLRGRVGRYRHRAYAFLLLPPEGRMPPPARERIHALQHHSRLGAGFRLALRDLELRGAGNVLGRQQSGHLAAVGFDLYCQLLRRSVARRRGENPPPLVMVNLQLDFTVASPSRADFDRAAVLPYDYVEDENQRLSLYRRLAGALEVDEISSLKSEIRDRFGPLPLPVQRLLAIAEIRILAAGSGIDSLEVKQGKVLMKRGEKYILRSGRLPRLTDSSVDQRLRELKELLSAELESGR